MPQEKSNIRERQRSNLRPPKQYKVIAHNDDFTTMDFVVYVLTRIFGKDYDDAEALTLEIHEKGQAVVGLYSYDMAMSKVRVATELARSKDFPLKLSIKED